MLKPIQKAWHSTLTNETAAFSVATIRREVIDRWLGEESKSGKGLSTTSRYCCFTYDDAKRAYCDPSSNWHWLDRELSSNLAGETGAVYIYKGALAALSLKGNNKAAFDFCMEHMKTESSHLRFFQSVVVSGKHTRLLPVWSFAGWSLGFWPTLLGGSNALYVTVESVETFVEEHFQDQILPLEQQDSCPELVRLLQHCCEDEVHHKEDAARHLLDDGTDVLKFWWASPWSGIVRKGSALAADVARRL